MNALVRAWHGPLLGVASIVAMCVLAVATRMLPLAISPYPYNNDGITESRISSDILSTGNLDYPNDTFYEGTHSVITPAYNFLLAFVSAVIGTDPFTVAQAVIAFLSVITVVGVYRIAMRITDSTRGALAAALFVALFGTFVFLTGSTWKASLGIALFVVMVFAYMNRSDRRMLALELVILATLPIVHHLVAVVAFMFLAYLAAWSFSVALIRRSLRRRHIVDASIVLGIALAAYVYYWQGSLDKLTYLDGVDDVLRVFFIILAIYLVMFIVLYKKSHMKFSFAPIPAALVVILFALDYSNPVFPYNPGSSQVILLFVLATSLLLLIGWYGIELSVESLSRFRAVPLGLLLPVMTMFAVAVTSGFDLATHQVIYRSFDFADIGLALGVGVAVAHMSRRRKWVLPVVGVVLVCLLITFPFGYFTKDLVGVRHDTQEYEVDAIQWVRDSGGASAILVSDIRLSFDARALESFPHRPGLPNKFLDASFVDPGLYNLYQEEWSIDGVDNYPYGHPVINSTFVDEVTERSNVIYVGGPESNSVVVFKWSLAGKSVLGNLTAPETS